MYSTLYLTIINTEVREYYKNNINEHTNYTKISIYYPTPFSGDTGLNFFDLGIKCELVDKNGKRAGYNILTSYQVASTGFSCSYSNISRDDKNYGKKLGMYLFGHSGKQLKLDPGCFFYLMAEDGDSFRVIFTN